MATLVFFRLDMDVEVAKLMTGKQEKTVEGGEREQPLKEINPSRREFLHICLRLENSSDLPNVHFKDNRNRSCFLYRR